MDQGTDREQDGIYNSNRQTRVEDVGKGVCPAADDDVMVHLRVMRSWILPHYRLKGDGEEDERRGQEQLQRISRTLPLTYDGDDKEDDDDDDEIHKANDRISSEDKIQLLQ